MTIHSKNKIHTFIKKSPQRAAGIFILPVASTNSKVAELVEATFEKLLISVEFRFEGTVNGNTDIVGLLLRKFGQLDTNLGEV